LTVQSVNRLLVDNLAYKRERMLVNVQPLIVILKVINILRIVSRAGDWYPRELCGRTDYILFDTALLRIWLPEE
jgi:hypothetical protein